MKRFAHLWLVTLGFGSLGFVLSLVPPKNATGAGGAPVIVTNTPLPVSGNVNAAQSGAWTVGVNNFPAFPAALTGTTVPVSGTVSASISGNVPIVNPVDNLNNPMPVTISTADDALRTPVGARCVINATAGSCTVYSVPSGSRLVIQSVSVSVTRVNQGIDPSETFFLVQTNRLEFAQHMPLFLQGSDSSGDYLTGQSATRMYADPNSDVRCGILFDGPSSATQGVLECEVSGQLVAVPNL